MDASLPVVVVGAGPVGLAAAAHLVERGLTPLVLERGDGPGTTVRAWAHVRVFSPWSYNVDAAAARLLQAAGWERPNPKVVPTGAEIVRRYLEPLAALPAIAPHLVFSARVRAVTRRGLDKMSSAGREDRPFVVAWTDREGAERRTEARAVIDASGTWFSPNPMGVDGLPVPGETEAADAIATGIPDVAGAERATYAGRTTLVVGSGHSAINIVLDLLRLQADAPETRVVWALRRDNLARVLGGGLNDRLPARGALGTAAMAAIEAGRLRLVAPFAAQCIRRSDGRLAVDGTSDGDPLSLAVDRIVVATGFRPDLSIFRELRVEIDPTVEAPPALGPLIDPNLHSCGTVPPHGAAELAHPEAGFYIVGMKSYGRAPTFLMATGHEQVRSVVAAIAGDREAAREVRLVLPETGACSAGPARPIPAAPGCCGPQAVATVAADACGA